MKLREHIFLLVLLVAVATLLSHVEASGGGKRKNKSTSGSFAGCEYAIKGTDGKCDEKTKTKWVTLNLKVGISDPGCRKYTYVTKRCDDFSNTEGKEDVKHKPVYSTPLKVSACTDSDRRCATWQSKGFCDVESSYVRNHCRRSCNVNNCAAGPKSAGLLGSTEPKEKPPIDNSVCMDLKPQCAEWKVKGHCMAEQYKDYMSEHCKRSCNINNCASGASPCTDSLAQCADWQRDGYCTGQHAHYMSTHCKRSCNADECAGESNERSANPRASPAITSTTAPITASSTTASVASTVAIIPIIITSTTPSTTVVTAPTAATIITPIGNTCTDSMPQCKAWKRSGHCKGTHAHYMSTRCKRSCNTNNCVSALLSDASTCTDEMSKCADWKLEGHCTGSSHSLYMSTHCKRSCNIDNCASG